MSIKLKKISVMISVMTIMVALITAIMTWINLPPAQNFLPAWISAFCFAFVFILPTGGLIFAAMNSLLNRLAPNLSPLSKNLFHGLLMAICMESIMATITTFSNHTVVALSQFFTLFINSFLVALPIGLGFALFMILVLKPRLARYLSETA